MVVSGTDCIAILPDQFKSLLLYVVNKETAITSVWRTYFSFQRTWLEIVAYS